MVAATDFIDPNGPASRADEHAKPKRRFRLFAALAAPFKDMDDRVTHRKRKLNGHRSTFNGSALAAPATGPATASLRTFPRRDG